MSKKPTSVRAIIIKNNKVLTLKRELENVVYWAFPGGHIEKTDKNEIEALKRECMEEVNITVNVGEKIFEQDFRGNMNYFYLCTFVKGEVSQGYGPEYTNPEKYEGTHIPEWIDIGHLNEYDLRPHELRDKILRKIKNRL